MEKNDFLQQTVDFLIDQCGYNQQCIETNQKLKIASDSINVDILVRNKRGKSYLLVMVENEARDRKELRIQLEEVLLSTGIKFGVYRYQNDNELPEFLGLAKKRGWFKKTEFYELEDYPKPNINFFEAFVNFLLHS